MQLFNAILFVTALANSVAAVVTCNNGVPARIQFPDSPKKCLTVVPRMGLQAQNCNDGATSQMFCATKGKNPKYHAVNAPNFFLAVNPYNVVYLQDYRKPLTKRLSYVTRDGQDTSVRMTDKSGQLNGVNFMQVQNGKIIMGSVFSSSLVAHFII